MGSASVSRPVHFTGPKKSTVQEGGLKSARRDEGSGAVVSQDEIERKREITTRKARRKKGKETNGVVAGKEESPS